MRLLPRGSKGNLIFLGIGLLAAASSFVRGNMWLAALFLFSASVGCIGLLPGVQAKIFPNLGSGQKLTSITSSQIAYFLGLAFVWMAITAGCFVLGAKASDGERMFLLALAIFYAGLTVWMLFAVWWVSRKLPRLK